jgi:hypothetical protein
MKIHRLLSSLQNGLTKRSSSYTIWFQMRCWMTSCLNHDYLIKNLIQPTISLEMPVPSQVHCGFPSFPVVDWFCLFVDLWVLPFPLEDCSVFGNFVITFPCFSWSLVDVLTRVVLIGNSKKKFFSHFPFSLVQ